MARKKHRRLVSCWLKWGFNKDGEGVIQLIYWRSVIYEKKVLPNQSETKTCADWWNAERSAHAWARRKGCLIIKEWLYA